MPHYEQLKSRDTSISSRPHNGDNISSSNINIFKPIMIALIVIATIAIIFSVIKYYSENIKLNVRNFFKKDKEIVEGLSINELSTTNLNKGFLNSFDNFKFLIEDDNNTNVKLSIDAKDIGSNKYITEAGQLYRISSNYTNTNKIDTITRETIEPFFNYYVNSNSITFANNNLPVDTIENEKNNDINFSWNNAFSWVKQRNNKSISETLNIDTNNMENILSNAITNNTNSRDVEYSDPHLIENSDDIESEYFNSVLQPRKNRVIINTMKPAYTPNKYRDEEYSTSNNIEIEEYHNLSYEKNNIKPKAKKKTQKVEERYTTKPSTNKKPVLIAREETSNNTAINNNVKKITYNTNYYIEPNNEKNIIVIDTVKEDDIEKENYKQENKSSVIESEIKSKNDNTASIEKLKKGIPSENLRKVIEYRHNILKNETATNKATIKKYTTVITNAPLKAAIEKNEINNENAEKTKQYVDNSAAFDTNITKYEPTREYNNDIISRNEKSKNSSLREGITKPYNNAQKESIERENSTEYNNQKNTITKNNIIKQTGITKPKKKNYIYLSSFDEKLGAISLIRKERSFDDNNIVSIINTLLSGATVKENKDNIFSAIARDTKLLDIFIEDKTLYINLSEEFEYNPLGSEGMIVAIYQIVYTATQFENIDNVIFLIDGKFNETIGSEGYIINKAFLRLSPDYNILEELR